MRGLLCVAVMSVLGLMQDGAEAHAQGAAFVTLLVTEPPRLDGRDDDPAWRLATPHRAFRMYQPRENADPDPRFPSEVRVVHGADALYVLVRAFDPEPARIQRRLARRDTYDLAADYAVVLLDSYLDKRNGYFFLVTPAGVKVDFLIFNDGVTDITWNGIWRVATAVDSLGWVAEFAIPFQQLRMRDVEAPTMGMMVGRWVGRTAERMSVPTYLPSMPGLVSQFGTLVGLGRVSRGARLEVAPYVLGQVRSNGASPSPAVRNTAGLDAKWLPSANVVVDATMNPDFGQVEADPAALQLTGIEVFQDERRPFFKEGAGLLSLPLGESYDGTQLFYTRRIGRHPSLTGFATPDAPTETTIDAAARVTARLAPATHLLALSTLTADEWGLSRPGPGSRYRIEPRAHFGVMRFQHEFRDGRSGAGLMLTRMDRVGDSTTSRFLPHAASALAATTQHQSDDGKYMVEGWAAVSDVQGRPEAMSRLQLNTTHLYQRPDDGVGFDSLRTSLGGAAARVRGGKFGGLTRFSGSYRLITPSFDVAEMGYLPTSGVQTVTGDVGLTATQPWRLLGIPFLTGSATVRFFGEWSPNGTPYSRNITLVSALQLPNRMQIAGSAGVHLPGGFCALVCTRGGPAIYDPSGMLTSLEVKGDPRRVVIPAAQLVWDVFAEDSRSVRGRLEVAVRPRSNLDVTVAALAADARHSSFFHSRIGDPLSDTTDHVVARLEQPTRSLTARVDYTLTPTLTAQLYSEAFLSRGTYSDLREVAEARAPERERRFRPVTDSALIGTPGGVDFKQFRSNLVVRWEYHPGSALYLVWSQGRDSVSPNPGTLPLWPGRALRDLFALTPRNSVTVKLSYWLSP